MGSITYEPWLVWFDMRQESHSQEQSAVSAAQSQESERTKASKACCFCCLTMRNTNNGDNGGRNESSADANGDANDNPSLDEIRNWARSFDTLMSTARGRRKFREFLRSEYSEENLLFWLACEELHKEMNPSVVEEKARLIYEDYISILSPKEVSLDSQVREVVNKNMTEPSPTTFDEAQQQIYILMHRDSFPRFVNSKMFRNLLEKASQNQ
ncbi:regulator of G-protein signaling rgs-2-like isoform X2 [Amphiura filiformis]|uniref:regulator of G-protein signaling rgs-2-like isoform X2 n=1 Tax=Amphiura filiformis TaxID=82378 RepID=UPI003B21A86F